MEIRSFARILDLFHLTRLPAVEVDTFVGMVSFTDLAIRGLTDQEGLELAPSTSTVR